MNEYNKHKLPKGVADILVDDILESSDEEVLSDAHQKYDDVNTEVSKTKALIKSAIMKSRKSKLALAEKQLIENKNTTKLNNVLTLPVDSKRKIIEEAKKSVGSLTLAARNEEETSETDTDSVLQDLIDLGVIDDNGNIK